MAQEQAPVAVAKLKAAGVTTVVLLADSAMVRAVLKQATANDYHPEWIYSGTTNIDLPLLARGYEDQEQWSHAFGLSNVPPGSPRPPRPPRRTRSSGTSDPARARSASPTPTRSDGW